MNTNGRIRFTDEWNEKVDEWAEENSAMIERYEVLRNYRKFMELGQELTYEEMDYFFHGGDFYSVYEKEIIVDPEFCPEEL